MQIHKVSKGQSKLRG